MSGFHKFETDHANITKSHMMDGLDAMGPDVSHILIRAARQLTNPEALHTFSAFDMQTLRDFANRGEHQYVWGEHTRQRIQPEER